MMPGKEITSRVETILARQISSMLAHRSPALSRRALSLRHRLSYHAMRAQGAGHVTIHHGRCTLVSHTFAGALAQVGDAAGHGHVGITAL
jgi:hypothetical protein